MRRSTELCCLSSPLRGGILSQNRPMAQIKCVCADVHTSSEGRNGMIIPAKRDNMVFLCSAAWGRGEIFRQVARILAALRQWVYHSMV